MLLGAVTMMAVLAAAPAQPAKKKPVFERLEANADLQRALKPNRKPLLVHLWAQWCVPCVKELPEQVALAQRAAVHGADVLFLDADGFENEERATEALTRAKGLKVARQAQVNTKLEAEEWGVFLDPSWKADLPSTFLYAADGTLLKAIHGTMVLEEEKLLLGLIDAQRKAKAK